MRSMLDFDFVEKLTIEVTKDNPEPKLLKKMMKQAGIKYSNDPIERINAVLKKFDFIDQNSIKDEIKKEKNR